MSKGGDFLGSARPLRTRFCHMAAIETISSVRESDNHTLEA